MADNVVLTAAQAYADQTPDPNDGVVGRDKKRMSDSAVAPLTKKIKIKLSPFTTVIPLY